MTRLPIRIRLTLAFTAAVAVLIAIGGTLLYLRLERTLDQSINQALDVQLAEVTALTRQADTGLTQGVPASKGGDVLAQVLSVNGVVIDATPQLRGASVLTATQLRRALRGPVRLDRSSLSAFHGPARLLAAPVHAQDRKEVIVVGASLSDRNQALRSLRAELLLGGPVALAIVALAGYLLARAALRPVERLRVEAQAVSATRLGTRLTLPAADDEVRRLGLTFNDLIGRLETSLGRQRRFVADASHELRTPLALLKTELDLALNRPRTNDELIAAVQSAAAETDHIRHLADDLLILARADETGLALRRSTTPISELLERVARRFRQRADDVARTIIVESNGAASASIDPTRLEQALSNLVDNALRHGAGAIIIRAERADGQLELHVIDDGPGLDAEFLPRAFERFSHPEQARGGRSAGLGLSIVAAIAEAHGGTVAVIAAPRQGTDFCITLPLS